MSRFNYYGYFTPTRPRAVKDGIKARSKRGAFAASWWATRWIKTLEQLLDRGRLTRGRRYARAGQVISLEEKRGAVTAKVQGSRRKPYVVSISVDKFTDREWEAIFDRLAERALFSAQLLAGEMPEEIESVFAAAGVSLFPAQSTQLHTDCSCPDWSNPCKHIAAVHYILGEQFDEDPFMLFRMRGRSQEQVLAALRARRAGEAEDETEDEVETETAATLPLPDDLTKFWGLQTPPVKTVIQPPAVRNPILKRLGQPKFTPVTLLTKLSPAYREISAAAVAAAERAE